MKDYEALPRKVFADAAVRTFRRAKEWMEQQGGETYIKWVRRAAAAIAPIAFSLLLSGAKLPLSTYPLGFSLLAAAEGDTLFFYVGTLLFSIISGEWPTAVGATALLIFRFIFSKVFTEGAPLSVKQNLMEKIKSGGRAFGESETLRLATAALAAFTAGMLRTVFGGFSIGDLVGTCLSVVLCPAVCYLYCGYFSAAEKGGLRYESGIVALLISFVFALGEMKPLGISLSVIAAAFFSFMIAKSKDPFSACLFALLSILACEPLLSPAFAVAAAMAAMLFPRSRLYAITAGSIAFAAVTYFVGRLTLFASFFPEFMLGAALTAPVSAATAEKLLPFFGSRAGQKTSLETEILTYKERKGRESIKDISEAFETLSKTFFDLSDKNVRIGLFDTRQICDRVCDRYCRRCAACTLCWERDYAVTLDTINKMSAKIYKSGKVQKSDLPPEFLARCHNVDKILTDIERENRRVLRSMLREDKTRAFAVDYAVFSRVLSEALAKNEAEYAVNTEARDAAVAELKKIGFYADSIGVYGKRCKNVYAFRLSKSAMQCKADRIKNALSTAFGGRVEDPVFEFADGAINMICHSAPTVTVACSSFSTAAKKGEENGDRVTAFDGKNGYWYAMVNDGMGSGRAAAKKSSAAAVFLEKMLRAGNSVSSGLEMLSALARADGEEGFTTLDLFELDTLTARGSFIKSGAAPSFVRRGNKLFKIRSKTFPLGILEDVDAERTTFDCMDGDRIVILSDGVTEETEEPLWLCEFLTAADLSAPDAAEKIIAEAKKHTLCRDDMTAAVVTINKI